MILVTVFLGLDRNNNKCICRSASRAAIQYTCAKHFYVARIFFYLRWRKLVRIYRLMLCFFFWLRNLLAWLLYNVKLNYNDETGVQIKMKHGAFFYYSLGYKLVYYVAYSWCMICLQSKKYLYKSFQFERNMIVWRFSFWLRTYLNSVELITKMKTVNTIEFNF